MVHAPTLRVRPLLVASARLLWLLGIAPLTAAFAQVPCSGVECCAPVQLPVAGTAGNDRLTASTGAACLLGEAGDDRLNGGAGADLVVGASGEDHGRGGDGDDTLDGGDGDDTLSGGAGDDTIDCGEGNDRASGGVGADLLTGGTGNDSLRGSGGDDTIEGGDGDDKIDGGGGNDRLLPGSGVDRVRGGGGDDTIVLHSPCEVAAGERLDGGGGYDRLETPLPLAELLGLGVVVRGMEEIVVTTASTTGCSRECPLGTHLVRVTGEPVLLEDLDEDAAEDTSPVDWGDYTCARDESCAGMTCSGHGTCDASTGVRACVCDLGYAGNECEECRPGFERGVGDVCVLGESCRRDSCSGHGNCLYDDGAVQCVCDNGVTGTRCTQCAVGFHGDGNQCVEDETCSPATCNGRGLCAVVDGAAQCACDAGYYGENCEGTCLGNNCNDRGTCSVIDDTPLCACAPGFDPSTDCASCKSGFELFGSGPTATCEVQATCTATSCSGHGACTMPVGVPSCACEQGYTGATCADCDTGFVRHGDLCIDLNACDALACGGHGTCAIAAGEATCTCERGFFGASCEEENPPTLTLVDGFQESLEPGQSAALRASVFGIGNFGDTVSWEIVDGGGSLMVSGNSATYTAPPSAASLQLVRIRVKPACCSGDGQIKTMKLIPPQAVPIQQGGGANDALFAQLDQILTDYMRARCIGSAVVAVSKMGGEVYRAGYGRTSGAPVNDVAWALRCPGDTYLDGPKTGPSTPALIGSNSKAITAAMAHEAGRRRWVERYGVEPTLAEIDSMKICDPEFNLLPEAVRKVQCGEVPLSFAFTEDTKAPSECTPDACSNGGTCQLKFWGFDQDYKAIMKPACACKPGYSGARCTLCASVLENPPKADPRWHDVTLGQLFRHRAGLRGSSIDIEDDVLPVIPTLRSLVNESDFAAQQSQLAPLLPDYTGALHALQAVRGTIFDPNLVAFFVLPPTREEIAIVNSGACLVNDPDKVSTYSNNGYGILQVITANVYGVPYSATPGHPESHTGSAVDQFVAEALQVDEGETSHGIYGAVSVPPGEPLRYRNWKASEATYYPTAKDNKRPDCLFHRDTAECDFGPWRDGDGFNFFVDPPSPTEVPLVMSGLGVSAGVGGLAVEHPVWLRFLAKYWVSGTSNKSSVVYGQPRSYGLWGGHTGSLAGARSEQMQIGTSFLSPCEGEADCNPGRHCLFHPPSNSLMCQPFNRVPPLAPDGHLEHDTANEDLVVHAFRVPMGVDVIFSVNQRTDPVCQAEEEAADPRYTCGDAYGDRMHDYLQHALSSVDWDQVVPSPVPEDQP